MKSIVIIGLGALGSHAALALRNFNLRLVDFDKVEQKNTLAQFHGRMGRGRNKAQALAQAFQGMWGLRPEVKPHKVTNDNVQVMLGGADLVIDCTDNVDARECIKGFCTDNDIPLLHSAMSDDGSFAQVVWTENFEVEAGAGGETCEDGANLTFHVLVGAYTAQVARDFIEKDTKRNFQITPGGVLRI